MSEPVFKLLAENGAIQRARLVTIRDRVTPLLATNYLGHFTDHSVNHSDHLCNLVDELASSLDQAKRLGPDEAFILYAACYFHDAGMQHERAGETLAVREVLQAEPYRGQAWLSLDQLTRQEIVRTQHHRVSRELVLDAVETGNPAIGISLNENEKPGVIAALCLAHCLSTDTNEYRETIANQGSIRVGLLSALLRLADILDESQRRTHLYLERTRELPIESRLHWWRHYYVSTVTIESRAVTVWFDFPRDRRNQYKELIEPLQMPWVDKEFKRHSDVLAANGLAWHLEVRHIPESQSTARAMDDELEKYAVEKAVSRQSDRLRRERAMTVSQLRVARPTVARQFAALRESTEDADQVLGKAVELAEHLTAIGGRRDAWMSLWGEFIQTKARATEPVRWNVALRLAELMSDDDASEHALPHIQESRPYFLLLPVGDPAKLRFLRVWAAVARDMCAYDESVSAYKEIARTTNSEAERGIASAEIAETQLLQGDLGELGLDG